MIRVLGVLFALMFVFTAFGPTAATQAEASYHWRAPAKLDERSGPSTRYKVKRMIPQGALMRVLSGPHNHSWYKVSYRGTTGYVSKRQAIVRTASRYLGYPYAYIGNTPKGFSCVGFTQWVYKLNRISIPQYLSGQYSMGKWVSRRQIQPGDLVFYQNTGWAGISHAAIYVGNGYMIGADNFKWGVHKDKMSDRYWSSRWYGARTLFP